MVAEPQDTSEPITGAVSDDENNEAPYWPELEEPEPENDQDFIVCVYRIKKNHTYLSVKHNIFEPMHCMSHLLIYYWRKHKIK